MKEKPIPMPAEMFGRLMEFLDRTHQMTCDPDFVADTVVLGEKLWDEVKDLAEQQGFAPTHTVVHTDSPPAGASRRGSRCASRPPR